MLVYALTSTTPGHTIDMLEDVDISVYAIRERLKLRLKQARIDGWSAIKEYRLVSKTADTKKYHQWSTIESLVWNEEAKEFLKNKKA